MARVTLQEVHKSYAGTLAVHSLSLEVADGEFLAILGPPGAGKSSTLKMIAGVESIDSGEVQFDGRCVNGVPPNKRNTAMVFESYALYPHLTAFDNIAYPLRARHDQNQKTEIEICARVNKVAELLQITEQLERKPAFLSGGQKQRVGLGRALVHESQVFLFDEPIAHLDARLRHQLRGELKRIQRERAMTLLYATPDYMEAIAMADRIAVLFRGQLMQLGTPAEILNVPASAEIAQFVGDPPMNILRGKLAPQEGSLRIEFCGTSLEATPRQQSAVESANLTGEVLVGIRPADLTVARSTPAGSSIRTEVYVWETLHRKTVLSLMADKVPIKVNAAPSFQVRIGEPLWLQFPPEKVFLFDPRTSALLPGSK